MSTEMLVLFGTAAMIGLGHTLLGPDHYLPFIVMAKARGWTRRRLLRVTLLCGLGHVAGSVLLGLLGLTVGLALNRLEAFESIRSSLAAWAIIAFGLVYCAWGLRHAWRNRPHRHLHFHADGHAHLHEHVHHREHAHPHSTGRRGDLTPWALFLIFVLGPCEPLIPLLIYPAAQHSAWGTLGVVLIFALATILTMTAAVWLGSLGLELAPLAPLQRYMHALAGSAICFSGLAIVALGL